MRLAHQFQGQRKVRVTDGQGHTVCSVRLVFMLPRDGEIKYSNIINTALCECDGRRRGRCLGVSWRGRRVMWVSRRSTTPSISAWASTTSSSRALPASQSRCSLVIDLTRRLLSSHCSSSSVRRRLSALSSDPRCAPTSSIAIYSHLFQPEKHLHGVCVKTR